VFDLQRSVFLHLTSYIIHPILHFSYIMYVLLQCNVCLQRSVFLQHLRLFTTKRLIHSTAFSYILHHTSYIPYYTFLTLCAFYYSATFVCSEAFSYSICVCLQRRVCFTGEAVSLTAFGVCLQRSVCFTDEALVSFILYPCSSQGSSTSTIVPPFELLSTTFPLWRVIIL